MLGKGEWCQHFFLLIIGTDYDWVYLATSKKRYTNAHMGFEPRGNWKLSKLPGGHYVPKDLSLSFRVSEN